MKQYPEDSHFEQRADMPSRESDWDYDCEASLEDYVDWRSERERIGENGTTADLKRCIAEYHTADTEIDK